MMQQKNPHHRTLENWRDFPNHVLGEWQIFSWIIDRCRKVYYWRGSQPPKCLYKYMCLHYSNNVRPDSNCDVIFESTASAKIAASWDGQKWLGFVAELISHKHNIIQKAMFRLMVLNRTYYCREHFSADFPFTLHNVDHSLTASW